MFGFLARSPQHYAKITWLHASMGSIYTLAISHDGELLASGGTDGMTIWRISSSKEIGSSGTNQDTCGSVSCAIWTKTRFSTTETLCYGTGLGYLVFLRPNPVDRKFQEICAKRLGAGFEITCIAWDASWMENGLRVAVGMRDNVVQVLLLDANSQLQPVFAGRLNDTVPRSVAFSAHESLYIFGLFDGKVIRMNIRDGNVLSEHCCGSIIGYAAVSLKKHFVVIDNAANGFTLYHLDSPSPIRTYITGSPTVLVPKQVAFGEDVKIVVGGSDNGNVYVFDRKSGKLLEMLRHARNGVVQSITVRDINGHCMIASASATPGRKRVTINIWRHQYAPPELNNRTNTRWTFSSLWTMIRVVAFVVPLIVLISLGIARLDPVPQIVHWCAKFQEERAAAILQLNPEPVKSKYAPASDESGSMTLQDMVEKFVALALQANHRAFVVHNSEEPQGMRDQQEEQVSAHGIIYL